MLQEISSSLPSGTTEQGNGCALCLACGRARVGISYKQFFLLICADHEIRDLRKETEKAGAACEKTPITDTTKIM